MERAHAVQTDVTDLSLSAAAALIERRALSPLELTKAYLARIRALNPDVNAYITVTEERALEDAAAATEEVAQGKYRGALHGIPISYKDSFATAGIRTTAGSRTLSEWKPSYDSAVVERLSGAGAVMLGKLNMHEFGVGATTNNACYGPTRNPWKLDRIPGGSSGGSGAAVAGRMTVFAMGTDTLGSVRIPAAFCGVVGLKPTFGRVSMARNVPMFPRFDHAGPLTRTVEDAALVLGAIAGHDPGDPNSAAVPVHDYLSKLRDGVTGLKIGIPRAFFFDKLHPEVAAAVEAALQTLQSMGAELREVALPDLNGLAKSARMVSRTNFQAFHAAALRERPADLCADIRRILALPVPSAEQLAGATRLLEATTRAFRELLCEVDLFATPTVPIPAPLIGDEQLTLAGVELPVGSAASHCAAIFSAVHLPALSVPCGFTSEGLPVGLQLAAGPFEEALLLRAGHAYEQATQWGARRPPELPAQ